MVTGQLLFSVKNYLKLNGYNRRPRNQASGKRRGSIHCKSLEPCIVTKFKDMYKVPAIEVDKTSTFTQTNI